MNSGRLTNLGDAGSPDVLLEVAVQIVVGRPLLALVSLFMQPYPRGRSGWS
jgi:hypothetical protein